MNKGAILHIPISQYAFAENEHELTIRIRTQKEDIRQCCLYYGDRVDPIEPIGIKKLTMKKVATDNLFDYYEAIIRDTYTRLCYYFSLDDGSQKLYYYGHTFCEKIACHRTEYFQFPYIRREDIIDIPQWAEDIVMYHIFPDSFASGKKVISKAPKNIELPDGNSSKSHLGGTLQGVIDNIDYLKALGVNCIYLNPIFLANSYHKYDTIDYFQIDPCFGDKETFKELVNKCHLNNIRVILDGVFNHCGANFFAFKDVLEKGSQSPYYDWFYYIPEPIEYKDPPNYEAFAYVKEMPKLNTGNPEVVDYLCKVGTYWISEMGIDGWRLDVANEINHDFWRKFRNAVRKVKSDVLLIAEIWEDAACWLLGDQFDSTMNYTFSYLCKDFFAKKSLDVKSFDEHIQRMIMRYPRRVSLTQMNFLDSHDVPRFLSYCNGDKKHMELAFFYLFMSVGIPSILYGDEYYLEGVEEQEYRKAMPWDQESTCLDKFKRWIHIRHQYEALRRGNYRCVYQNNEKGCYGFIREYREEKLLILLNNGGEDIVLSIEGHTNRKLLDLVSGERIEKEITLTAISGCVYEIIK